ncbi:MAG: hypothetical protein ABID38_01185 [Candidatus Diapherotrites archaeon]
MLKELKEKLRWLDPFTYVDMFIVDKVKGQNKTIQNIVFLFSMALVSVLFYLFAIKGAELSFLPIIIFIVFTALIYFVLKEEYVEWGIYLATAFILALVVFSASGLILGTDSPMVIVVSGSMEPFYYRGDVVFLQGVPPEQLVGKEVTIDRSLKGIPLSQLGRIIRSNGETTAIQFNDGPLLELDAKGDIVVYPSSYINGPVIHRIVAKINAKDGIYLITKGDNNTKLDQETAISPTLVDASKITGRSVFDIPAIGYVKLILFDDLSILIFGCPNQLGCPFP